MGAGSFLKEPKGHPDRWAGRRRREINRVGPGALKVPITVKKNTHTHTSPSGRCCSLFFFSQFYQLLMYFFLGFIKVEIETLHKGSHGGGVCNKMPVIVGMPNDDWSSLQCTLWKCLHVSKKWVGSRKHLSHVTRFLRTVDSQTLGTRVAGDYASPVPVSNATWWPLPLHPSPRVPTLHLQVYLIYPNPRRSDIYIPLERSLVWASPKPYKTSLPPGLGECVISKEMFSPHGGKCGEISESISPDNSISNMVPTVKP